MQRKSLAIVSSYNTQCGNASYTHVLKEEFSKHFATEIVAVNHKLLANPHPKARAAIASHIADLTAQLRRFDYVNIQFEAGLYGHSLASAVKNITPLIAASRNLLFTMHRVHNPEKERPLWVSLLRNGSRLSATLRDLSLYRANKSYEKLAEALRSPAHGNRISVLVHTQREKELLRLYYGLESVVDYPITFLTREQITAHVDNRARIRAEVFEQYKFDPNDRYIGIFGFLSENKGHHTAINALRYLPKNYKLAVFGGQHPMAIRDYDLGAALQKPELFQKNNNTYIASMIELAENVSSQSLLASEEIHAVAATSKYTPQLTAEKSRVRFVGNVSDPDFIRAITAMDFVVAPYLETGQGGSGNASLVLELQSRVIFSRTFAFMELSRYYPDCFQIADIGNAQQIAQQISFWNAEQTAAQQQALGVYNIENNILMQKELFEKGLAAASAFKEKLRQTQ